MSDNFHLQLYRGTTAQNNAYTGPAGELTVDTTLSKLRLHDGSTAGGVEIGGMPTGSIIPYAGSTAPAGYLLCDGSAISRSTYSALFAIIGTTYGEGDGNSTFNIPSENDFPLGIPSNNFIELTLEASGTHYVALANGYIYIQKQSNSGQAVSAILIDENNHGYLGIRNYSSVSSGYSNAFTPVKKGQKYSISYTNTSTTGQFFRFVYAEGQPSIIKY